MSKTRELTLGTLLNSKGRYYWRGVLPGETDRTTVSLKPNGARYATTDFGVAFELAETMIQQKIFDTKKVPTKIRTIADLSRAYLIRCDSYYQSEEPQNIKYAIRELVGMFAAVIPDEFGPLKLAKLQESMIERGLTRGGINKRIGMIKRMFRWAVSKQLISVSVIAALDTVEGIRKGRTQAKESKKVKPVKPAVVEATIPYMGQTIADMVEIQRLTGMRSTETCVMKPENIDTSDEIWIYTPGEHKGRNLEDYERIVPIGPQAQALLQKYMFRDPSEYCFKPDDSEQNRGWQRQGLNDRYDARSYRRAIKRAVSRANLALKEKLREQYASRREAAEAYMKLRLPRWHPHQMRHTYGTVVRKERGIEAARAALGHKKIQTTEIYAERDLKLAIDAAKKFG